MKNRLLFLAVLGILTLSLVPAHGQVATLLMREGDPLPGGPVGHIVGAINNSAVNHAGGFAFTVNTSDGVTTLSHSWGHATGGPGIVLFTEGTYGIFEQTSWESFFGFSDDGFTSYSPLSTNMNSGSTSLDGVWLDAVPIAVEEEPYPHLADWWWSFGSRPGVTADGTPYWVGGITDVQGGSTDNRGLFYGMGATPVLLGGDMVVGLPDPLATASTVSFDYRYSAFGNHYIAEVQTETGSTTNDNHVVIDGAVAMIGGSPISEATLVPPVAGGLPDESWDNFDFMGIAESGTSMFTGDTDGAAATDEFIAIDGTILFREGMTLDDEVLSGSIEGAFMNEQGDYAFIWDILDNTAEALYFRDQLLLKEGDMVDIDGDLVPDPGTAVTDFTGISALTLSDQSPGGLVRIYFTADVEFPAAALGNGTAIVVKDPEAAGLTEAEIAELRNEDSDSRAVLEGAFVITVPAVVPAFLSNFSAKQQGAEVAIDWSIAAAEFGEFRLVGRQNGTEWDVDFAMSDQGRFVAQDDRAEAGNVTYTLYHRWEGSDWNVLNRHDLVVTVLNRGTRLLGASPNPFNPQTSVEFSVDRLQQVRVWVCDLSGRRLVLLTDQQFGPGTHAVPWDGRDGYGRAVASGTYLAVMEGDQVTDSTKLLLVR
ncbi:MAG: hypothetical protein ABIF77_18820 [bacterium]